MSLPIETSPGACTDKIKSAVDSNTETPTKASHVHPSKRPRLAACVDEMAASDDAGAAEGHELQNAGFTIGKSDTACLQDPAAAPAEDVTRAPLSETTKLNATSPAQATGGNGHCNNKSRSPPVPTKAHTPAADTDTPRTKADQKCSTTAQATPQAHDSAPPSAADNTRPAKAADDAGNTPSVWFPGFLPAETEVTISLQHLAYNGFGDLCRTTAVGSAQLKLERCIGRGASADVYLARVLSYDMTTEAPSSSKPAVQPPWDTTTAPPVYVAIKIARERQPDLSSNQRHSVGLQLASLFWQELCIMCDLQKDPGSLDNYSEFDADYFTKAYGYGRASMSTSTTTSSSSSDHPAATSSNGSLPLEAYPDGHPCLIMEWAEYGSVFGQLQLANGISKPMSANQAWFVVTEAHTALLALQDRSYISLDFKASNLLLAKQPGTTVPHLRVCDFGSTKQYRINQSFENDGSIGTPAFMPPEQFLGPWSDTWLLGMLLVTCRGGGMPHGHSLQELRDSRKYQHLMAVEWQLLELCLNPDAGSRLPLHRLSNRTQYFKQKPCMNEVIDYKALTGDVSA